MDDTERRERVRLYRVLESAAHTLRVMWETHHDERALGEEERVRGEMAAQRTVIMRNGGFR